MLSTCRFKASLLPISTNPDVPGPSGAMRVTVSVDRPKAPDLDISRVKPDREFEICNELLDDYTTLDRFYQDNGYLFFRDVLDPSSVEEARDAMLAVAADTFGLVEKGDVSARWTGRQSVFRCEEAPEFAGISQRLVDYPTNQSLFTRILGERASMVPIVQYRLYPPGGHVSAVHQDGFYSPGVQDLRPLWIPLVPCPRALGGLMLAIGQHKGGYLHNIGKPSPFPIPDGVIDPASWATIDYAPGDLLVVHPASPHGSMPNRTDRLRVTLDTRVQSASNPRTFAATIIAVTANSITVKADAANVGTCTLVVDENTFIRVRNPGIREALSDLVEVAPAGKKIVVVRDEDRALMLRAGSCP